MDVPHFVHIRREPHTSQRAVMPIGSGWKYSPPATHAIPVAGDYEFTSVLVGTFSRDGTALTVWHFSVPTTSTVWTHTDVDTFGANTPNQFFRYIQSPIRQKYEHQHPMARTCCWGPILLYSWRTHRPVLRTPRLQTFSRRSRAERPVPVMGRTRSVGILQMAAADRGSDWV